MIAIAQIDFWRHLVGKLAVIEARSNTTYNDPKIHWNKITPFLGENQMFTIPPHIGMMSSLKELYINDNPDLQVIYRRPKMF